MDYQENNSGHAFFYDMEHNRMVDMPHPQTNLPESLALKVNNKAMPTRDELDALISKANKNREKILQLKVQKAKKHDQRVEQVKQLKKEMDENMTLLGNTIPWNQRTLSTSPTLPKRLMKRLQTLEKQSPPKTADMIRLRENRAEENRNRFLEEKREKARNSAKEIPRQSKEPPVPPPYQASVLPPHLVKRLASLPPKRTTKQLLDSYSRASKNRQGFLRVRQEAIREHLQHVETLRMQHNNKAKIKLPSRLAKRLERIAYHHTPEEILAKEAKAAERKKEHVQAIVHRTRNHLEHVKQVSLLGKERKSILERVEHEIHALPDHTSADLPDHLRQKLQAYVSTRKSPKQILDHESEVAIRRQQRIQQQVTKAKLHSDKVELMRMTRPNLQVPKLTTRLAKLLEQRNAQHKKSAADILARHKNASLRREDMMLKRVNDAKKATDRSYHIARVAKANKQKVVEDARNVKLLKAAEFLPDHLKQRLLLFPQPTKYEILDRLNFAEVKRAKLLQQRVNAHKKHTQLVEERKMMKFNNKKPKLTKKLKERLIVVDAKKRSPVELLDRERKAIERRQLLLCKKANELIEKKEHAEKVNRQKVIVQQELLTEVHPVEGAAYLPKHLKRRLASFRKVTKRDILDRESRIFAARKSFLEQVSAKAAEHCEKVELMRMCKMNKKCAKLPKRLQERLKKLKHEPKSCATMQDNAAHNRAKILNTRAEKAKVHNDLAKQRSLSRRRRLEEVATMTA